MKHILPAIVIVICLVFVYLFAYHMGQINGIQHTYLNGCQEAYIQGFNDSIEVYED